MSKFSIRVLDPKGFARAFKLCAGIAHAKSRHGTNPICSIVLLTVSGFKATMQATDLSQYLTINLGLATQGLSLDGEGCLTLPNDWKVPKEPFTLESEPSETGPMVTLHYSAVTQNIPQPHKVPDEYPCFPPRPEPVEGFNAGVKFELPGAELAHHLSKLSEYTASEKGRYALNGLLWEFGGEVNQPLVNDKDSYSVQLVATDGRHLAAHALSVSTKKAPRFQSILHFTHAQNLAGIIKTLDSAEEPNIEVAFPPEVETTNDKGEITEVTPRESCMFFGNRKWNLATRLVEGQFPDWHSVVPKNDVTVLLRRQEYIDALQAVKHACSVEACAVKHTFNADHLLLEAKSVANGYARAQVSLPTVPPQMILGLDPEYLLQALYALHGEWVIFEFRSSEYGINLHDGAPEKRYHLVMPIDVFGDRPEEPKKPEFEEKEETWLNGAWHKLTPEEKAEAKAKHEEAMREYEKDLAAWRIELEQWRISKRYVDTDDSFEEQKPGTFFPRPAHEPEIGVKLANVPTLAELKEQALTANVVEKPKAKALSASLKAGKAPVAPAAVAAPTLTALSAGKPAPQPIESYSHEEEHLETAAELGYGLDKNQMTFGF